MRNWFGLESRKNFFLIKKKEISLNLQKFVSAKSKFLLRYNINILNDVKFDLVQVLKSSKKFYGGKLFGFYSNLFKYDDHFLANMAHIESVLYNPTKENFERILKLRNQLATKSEYSVTGSVSNLSNDKERLFVIYTFLSNFNLDDLEEIVLAIFDKNNMLNQKGFLKKY